MRNENVCLFIQQKIQEHIKIAKNIEHKILKNANLPQRCFVWLFFGKIELPHFTEEAET